MPAGAIEHQDHMDIGPCLFTDEPQVMIHVLGVDGGSQ
jgi:hypothetical protein